MSTHPQPVRYRWVFALIGCAVLAGAIFRAANHRTQNDLEAPGVYQVTGPTMGTTYSVKLVLPSEEWEKRRQSIQQTIQDELDRVDDLMSTYKPDSELSRLNRHADDAPFPLSPETFEVLQLARSVSEASSGAFDVTVGPLVDAWGFGPQEKTRAEPSDDELTQLRASVSFRGLILDDAERTVRKLRPEVHCDLSAIAKGYAVDRTAQSLERLGIRSYMVEVGGEIRTH
ncbi:MAG TPA: FAD:protein FMN transferase, partial [Candidatus Hydrogenedentes bacterium]|nr:FAD:protein FMN transferase [Candidatus Hydrogenedentota bacterium]